MAGLIKELLLDYSQNKLSVEQQSDITIAIQQCIASGLYTTVDVTLLDLFLQGYDAVEIAKKYELNQVKIEAALSKVFRILEQVSDYTDEAFIKRIESLHKYPESKVATMANFLNKHGNQFNTHELSEDS